MDECLDLNKGVGEPGLRNSFKSIAVGPQEPLISATEKLVPGRRRWPVGGGGGHGSAVSGCHCLLPEQFRLSYVVLLYFFYPSLPSALPFPNLFFIW